MSVSPPLTFGIVERGVFRSVHPHESNLPFLAQLGLRTVVNLSEEDLSRAVHGFLAAQGVTVEHLGGGDAWAGHSPKDPPSEELTKRAIELLLDASRHPALVCCSTGVHVTGAIVGCLRRLQRWNLSSVIDEFRNHATGATTRFAHEQFVEIFDCDLVTLPPRLPDWFALQEDAAGGAAAGWMRGPLVSPGTRFSEKKSLCDDEDD